MGVGDGLYDVVVKKFMSSHDDEFLSVYPVVVPCTSTYRVVLMISTITSAAMFMYMFTVWTVGETKGLFL